MTPEAPSADETWAVLHLFARIGAGAHRAAIEQAVDRCERSGHQVVSASLLGHKADVALMALGPEPLALRTLQSELREAGLELSYSFVSRTEVSEYAAGIPRKQLEARLHPVLPPAGMPAYCFYPMSKRREGDDNWYRLDYERRLELMRGHGMVGRNFRGRVIQLVTGSTGLDDYEWGVTLFGGSHDDLKDCVYEMRFDEASARYADFGPFYTGTVGALPEVLDLIGGR